MVTQVLQQQHAAVRERFAFRFSLATDAVGGELNRCAQQLRQPRGNRPQAVFRVGLALGPPRCEARTSRAPLEMARRSVGRVSRTRVSSVTLPASSGTL